MATESLTLVCLPFAGGGAGFYRAWKEIPTDGFTVLPLQLPGREERFLDEPFTDALEAAGDLAAQADRLIGADAPFALFGHSLGAVLAYECARELERLRPGGLRQVYVSGSPGPWSGRTEGATGLGDDEFLARVQEFAGYRHEALDDPDLREVLLPLLRADVAMHEDYKPASADPIGAGITSLRGADDTLVSAEEARQWQDATSGPFSYRELPGGHMYLADSPEALLRALAETR